MRSLGDYLPPLPYPNRKDFKDEKEFSEACKQHDVYTETREDMLENERKTTQKLLRDPRMDRMIRKYAPKERENSGGNPKDLSA